MQKMKAVAERLTGPEIIDGGMHAIQSAQAHPLPPIFPHARQKCQANQGEPRWLAGPRMRKCWQILVCGAVGPLPARRYILCLEFVRRHRSCLVLDIIEGDCTE